MFIDNFTDVTGAIAIEIPQRRTFARKFVKSLVIHQQRNSTISVRGADGDIKSIADNVWPNRIGFLIGTDPHE